MTVLKISVCLFQNGEFDVMFKGENGEAVTLSGSQNLNVDDIDFLCKVAPACVFTEYEMKAGQ